MDLSCLTWIISLGMVEQRRLKATSIVVTPLVSLLPTVTIEASTGGEESCIFHPWSIWDVRVERACGGCGPCRWKSLLLQWCSIG